MTYDLWPCAGLEAQLLGIVVRKERPDLEETKDNLVRGIAGGKKKLLDLENVILRYGTWEWLFGGGGHCVCVYIYGSMSSSDMP